MDEFYVKEFFRDTSQQRYRLLQNKLMRESKFIRFIKDRGIAVSGVVQGDPSKFCELGWLTNDNNNNHKYLFHPFRLLPVFKGVELCRIRISATSTLNKESLSQCLDACINFLPENDNIGNKVKVFDLIADLAIILEPIYWPSISGFVSYSFPEGKYDEEINQYRVKALDLVKKLSPELWDNYHEQLRIHSAGLDDNSNLYMLLRCSPWTRRERITGQISGSMWIKHIAELIRLAFFDTHGVTWKEEDEAFGQWAPGARTTLYGNERPLDNVLSLRSHIAFEFGLYRGSIVKWYLEGQTEYYAVKNILPSAAQAGVELINLKGLLSQRKSIPLTLAENLKEDKQLKRFSIITFDTDVSENVKFIKTQISRGNIVGYVNCNNPDFEFANFELKELINLAISLDKKHKINTDELAKGDWSGIKSGSKFEERYKVLSRRGVGLKGEEWGNILGEYAIANPFINGKERPFITTLHYVLQSRSARYDYHIKVITMNAETFENETISE